MFSQLLGDPGAVGVPDQQVNAGTIGNVMNVIYLVAGAVAVIVGIIGGIQFTTSSGDASKAAKARNTLLYSVIGLVVVSSAFAITNFVIGRL